MLDYAMDVDIQLVNGIVNGRRSVTAETALLFAKVLKTTPELWLNAQMAVDLWHAGGTEGPTTFSTQERVNDGVPQRPAPGQRQAKPGVLLKCSTP
jgi:addiction module HigA family antidote